MSINHRGRLQSQGGGINDSQPWAQKNPLTLNSAINMSNALEAMASPSEKILRTSAHAKSRKFMTAAQAAGGVGVTSKTFMVPNDRHRRVDIEVRKGIAFQ
jgi:hypothetical protein